MADRKKPQSRRWQAMLIRNRGESTIEVPDKQAAERIAAERYGLTQQQLTRLALREMR